MDSTLFIKVDAGSGRRDANELAASLDGVERAGNKTTAAVDGLNRKLIGFASVATAAVFAGITKGAVDAGKEFQRLERLLSNSDLAFVRAEADRLGLSLIGSANGFAQITAAAAGTSLEGEKARQIFTGLQTAVTGLGLSAEQSNGALKAFEQIISKGTVQAEELRGQLGERIPGAFQVAARAMNLTTQELGKQLELGKVVSEDFLPKFAAELEKTYSGRALTGAQQLTAEQNRFNNSLQELQFAIGEGGVVDAVTESFRGLTDVLKSPEALAGAERLGAGLGVLVSNLDDLALAVGALVGARSVSKLSDAFANNAAKAAESARQTAENAKQVAASVGAEAAHAAAINKKSLAVVASTSADVRKIETSRLKLLIDKQNIAEQLKLEARLRKTTVDTEILTASEQKSVALRKSMLAVNQKLSVSQDKLSAARAKATAAAGAQTTSDANLSKVQAAATAATNAQTAAVTRSTVAMQASAAASKVLGTSLALVGGPAGLAVIGAVGVYKMATSMTEAEQQSVRLKAALNDLGVNGLDPATAKTESLRVEMLEVAIASERTTLAAFNDSLRENQKEVDIARERMEELREALKLDNLATDAIDGINDELIQLAGNLTDTELTQKTLNIQIEQSKAALSDYEKELFDATLVTVEFKDATEEAEDSVVSYGSAVDKILKKEDDHQKAIDEITAALEGNLKGNVALQKELDRLTGKTDDHKDVVEDTRTEYEKLTDAYIENAEKVRSLAIVTVDAEKALFGLDDASLAIQKSLSEFNAEQEITNSILEKAKLLFIEGAIELEEFDHIMETFGDTGKEAAEKTNKYWEQATEGIQDSMAEFFRTGLDDWDSFTDSIEDLFKDMLAEMAAAWLASGVTQWLASASQGNYSDFSGFNSDAFFGGGSIGNSGNSNGSNPANGSNGLINQAGESLGLTAEQTSGIVDGASGIYNIYGGVQSFQNGDEVGGALQTANGGIQAYNGYQQVVGGTELTGAYSSALGFAGSAYGLYNALEEGDYLGAAINGYQTYTSGTALYGSLTGTGTTTSLGTATALPPSYTGSAVALETGATTTTPTSTAAASNALAYVAGAAVIYDWADDLFGGRTPEQIGADQLTELRNSGQSSSSVAGNLSNLGSIEGSQFYDVKSDANLDVVGDLLEQIFGIQQAHGAQERAAGQGSQFGARQFALNGDDSEALRVVAGDVELTTENILAAIAAVEVGLSDLEINAVTSFGTAISEIDTFFDATEGSTLTTTQRILDAVSNVYGVSTEEAQAMVEQSGISFERLAELFEASSGQVLEDAIAMSGNVSDAILSVEAAGEDSANGLSEAFQDSLSKTQDAAEETTDFISGRFGRTTNEIASSVEVMAQSSASSFGSIADTAVEAAKSALRAFRGLEDIEINANVSANSSGTDATHLGNFNSALSTSFTSTVPSSGISMGADSLYTVGLVPNREEFSVSRKGSIDSIERKVDQIASGSGSEDMKELKAMVGALVQKIDQSISSNDKYIRTART